MMKFFNNLLKYDANNIVKDSYKLEMMFNFGFKKLYNKTNWEASKNECHVNESV